MRIDKNLCARKCCLLAQALPVLAAFLVTSCGIFLGKPALPRNPVGTSSDSSQNQFTAAKARADVVYLQDDRQVANSGQNTALKILDALQGHDARMAIGWASVDLTQQPVLNQWQEQKISAEELLARLPSAEVAQMASAGTDLVRQMLRPDIAQLALGCPRDLFTKVRLGEKFSDEERPMIPSGFTAPPNDFERFRIDRIPNTFPCSSTIGRCLMCRSIIRRSASVGDMSDRINSTSVVITSETGVLSGARLR
jgi:hypothetical protein